MKVYSKDGTRVIKEKKIPYTQERQYDVEEDLELKRIKKHLDRRKEKQGGSSKAPASKKMKVFRPQRKQYAVHEDRMTELGIADDPQKRKEYVKESRYQQGRFGKAYTTKGEANLYEKMMHTGEAEHIRQEKGPEEATKYLKGRMKIRIV